MKVIGEPAIDNGEEGEKLISVRLGTFMQDCRLLCNLTFTLKETFMNVRDGVMSLRKEV